MSLHTVQVCTVKKIDKKTSDLGPQLHNEQVNCRRGRKNVSQEDKNFYVLLYGGLCEAELFS